jgi:hypothetical protein
VDRRGDGAGGQGSTHTKENIQNKNLNISYLDKKIIRKKIFFSDQISYSPDWP